MRRQSGQKHDFKYTIGVVVLEQIYPAVYIYHEIYQRFRGFALAIIPAYLEAAFLWWIFEKLENEKRFFFFIILNNETRTLNVFSSPVFCWKPLQ